MNAKSPIHKNIYIDSVASLKKFFQVTPARNQRETRQRNRMHMVVPKAKTVCGQNAIGIRGPMHWNSIPNDLRLIDKYKLFVRKLKARTDGELDNHPT